MDAPHPLLVPPAGDAVLHPLRLHPAPREHHQLVSDAINNVIFGCGTVDNLREAVEQWRSRGGDDIRAEYEALLQEQG